MPWYAPGFGQHPHWAAPGSALEREFLAQGWVQVDGAVPTPDAPVDPAAARLVRAINGKLADITGGITLTPPDIGALDQTAGDARYLPKSDATAYGLVATNLDATGGTSVSTKLQAWLDAIPDGGKGTLPPGTYLAAGLTITGKSVDLDCAGATIIQDRDATLLKVTGKWDATLPVTSITRVTNQLNTDGNAYGFRDQSAIALSVTPPWKPGDVIRVFSDDLLIGRLPNDGTNEARSGEFATVYSVSGTTVYTDMPLRESAYGTNIRVARLLSTPVRLRGLSLQAPDSGMPTYGAPLLEFRGALQPKVENLRIKQGGAIGVVFRGCFGYEISGAQIGWLNDRPSANQYGYGILDAGSEAGMVDAPVVRYARHAFTTDMNKIPVGTTDPALYGRTRDAVVRNGRAYGTSNVAWDTHHSASDVLFTGCRSVMCGGGTNFRGYNHTAVDCHAVNCATGHSVMQESGVAPSQGHRVINCYTEGALYRAIDAVMLTNPGVEVLAVIGGRHYSELGPAIRVDKANIRITGNAELTCRTGSAPNGTQLLALTNGATVDLDGARFNWSPNNLGNSLSFVTLDATSAVTGRRTTFIAGSAASRVSQVFLGASNSGTVALRDYSLDAGSIPLLASCSPASRVSDYLDFGYALTFPPNVGGGTTVWAGANDARYIRLLGGGTISKIGLHVATASGNISVAVYRRSGTGRSAVPGAQLATSGSLACPAAGYAEISLGSTVTVQPGDFLALSCDNATAAFVGFSGQSTSNLFSGQSFSQPSAHPLPVTPSALTATGYRLPALVGV